MKRHLKEERTGSIKKLIRNSITLFCILFFNIAYSQIPIKGFCDLNSFPFFPGFTQLTSYDVNNDSIPDLILYSANQKSIVIAEGKTTYDFNEYKLINVPYYLSNIIPIYDKIKDSMSFVFTSRKNRTAGVFKISDSGKFKSLARLEFDSFPENIIADDINNDGEFEYLISGSGFNGLSVLSYKEGDLEETKINLNQSYSEAVFADLSNDGFPDIAAFNLFSNSIDIFYNDGSGNFELVRQIIPQLNMESMQLIDINNDEYVDLVYSAGNSINIVFGDFSSAYDSSLIITTQYTPHRYVVGNFNSDIYYDIAYIDTTIGLVSMIFGKNRNQFYDEILYLKKKGIVDLTTLSSSTSVGLALLNYYGVISTISKISSLQDELNIVPVVETSVITSFDYGNDGVPDIAYIDDFSKSMNILINGKNGIPLSFYSEAISGDHGIIKVNDTYSFRKIFCAYTPGNKMLEAIKFDFMMDKKESHQLYVPGAITDVETYKSKNSERIYIIYKRNNLLRFGEYKYQNSEYVFKEYAIIDSNVIAGKIYSLDKPVINYWKTVGDSLQLKAATISNEQVKYTKSSVIRIMPEFTISFLTYFLSDKNIPVSFTMFSSVAQYFGIVSDKSLFNISQKIGRKFDFVFDKSKLLYFEDSKRFVNQVAFLYIWKDGYFNKMELNSEGNKLTLSRLFDAKQVTDFIVKEFTNGKKYLIYSQQSEGFISLKRLK